MKIVVSNPEDGKSYQKEIDENQQKALYGKKIGESVKGDAVGLVDYELELTGGSDKQGFPMRIDLHGSSRKQILLSSGPGYKQTEKGGRRRKSIRGNTVSEEIAQLNMKVKKAGKDSLDKVLGKGEKKEETKPEAKKEKAEPTEEKKEAEEPKKEEPKAEEKKE